MSPERPSPPTAPSSPAAAGTPGAARGGSCLDLAAIEAIATERAPDAAEQAHLDACPSCRQALADFRANAKLLTRFRLVIGDGAVVEPAPAPPVDLVPGYRILEEISRGSQGIVYKAFQERTKRVVALKMLLRGTFATEKQRRRFEREAEIAAGLKHTGIVTIYDVTLVRGGRYAYAMEYVAGVHLDAWRPPGKTARERRAAILKLFAQVCDAVQYAHNNGVMHRDLKPANIIVDDAGAPHILDFGIAKATGRSHAGAAATLSAEFAGTLAYASPEQVAGNPEMVDARTDVYSLGVMLYHMVCGRPPCSLEGSILDVAARIQTEEPVRPRAVDPSIGSEVEAVMLHALRKEPGQRYQSPGALGRDLDRCLAGEPVAVKRDSAWYMLRKMVARHRRVVAPLVAAGILVIGSIAAVAYSRIQTAIARGRMASERDRAAAETVRVGALSAVLRDILPPVRERPSFEEARRVDDGLFRLRGKVALGYMADDPAREAAAQTMLALAFRDRGMLPFAEESLRLAICRLVAEHGERHPAVAQALFDLSSVLLDRQRLWEAQRYCEQSLAMRTELLGEDDPKTAESLELRARILVGQGKPAEGLGDAEAAAAVLAKSAGTGELPLAGCLDTEAAALAALGRRADAENACRRALAIRLDRLSDDDRELADSLSRLAAIIEGGERLSPELAGVARAIGHADGAALAAHLKNIATNLPPPRAPDARTAPNPAAVAARDAALADLLALKRAMLGSRSRGVGQTLAGMGWRLLDVEKWAPAEAPLREALSVLEERYGADDLAIANCLERLGDSLMGQYRFAEAADVQARALAIWRKQPGASLEGINVPLVQREMAKNLTRAGKYDEAIRNFEEAIAAFGTNQGPMHHARGLAMSQCALALLGAGRVAEAEKMAREGREIALKNPALPGNQRMEVDAALGIVLVERGGDAAMAEAEPLLMSAQRFFDDNSWTRDSARRADVLAVEQAVAKLRK